MANRQLITFIIVTVPLFILSLIGIIWANNHFSTVDPSLDKLGGDHFLPRWLGTRLYILEGQSPYSTETVKATQEWLSSRSRTDNQSTQAGEDPQFFLYPFYSFLIFLPFAIISDFLIAKLVWMSVLLITLYTSIIYSLSLINWRVRGGLLIAFLIFSGLWFPGVYAVFSGNAVVLVTLLIVLTFHAIRAGYDGLASMCMVAACIKPNTVLLLIIFILVWAASQRRWALVGGFIGTAVLLTAATSMLVPDWLLSNIKQVIAFIQQIRVGTPEGLLVHWLPGIGRQMGWVLTGIVTVILLIEWRATLGRDWRWFLWTACLTLTLTNLFGIHTSTGNYFLMYPAFVLTLATWQERWDRIGLGMGITTLIILLIGPWILFWKDLLSGLMFDLDPLMFFGLPLIILAGLYWVRWWAIRSAKLPLETLVEATS